MLEWGNGDYVGRVLPSLIAPERVLCKASRQQAFGRGGSRPRSSATRARVSRPRARLEMLQSSLRA